MYRRQGRGVTKYRPRSPCSAEYGACKGRDGNGRDHQTPAQIAHPLDIEPDQRASDRDRLEPDPGKALPPGGLDQDVGLLEVRHNILLPVTVHQAWDGAAGLLRIEQRTFAQHVESDIYAAAVEDGREFDDGSRILR